LYKKIKQFVVPFTILKYISFDNSGSVYYSINKPTLDKAKYNWEFNDFYIESIRATVDF